MLNNFRSLIRTTGLTRIISPWLSSWEQSRLFSFGKLEPVRTSPATAEIRYGTGQTVSIGPPPHFAYMACSRHEVPTLVAILNICGDLLQGGVAWDVGGNAGFYSALLSTLVGPSGRVYGFEPLPATFDLMCANLETARCVNVTPLNIALSDHDGQMAMSFDPADNTVSSLEVRSGSMQTEVRVASGDTLVKSGECQIPVMLKLDIEGHELKALSGMREVLASVECRAVLCEIHFAILASKGQTAPAREAKKLLQAAGFKDCRFISRSHLLATKERF